MTNHLRPITNLTRIATLIVPLLFLCCALVVGNPVRLSAQDRQFPAQDRQFVLPQEEPEVVEGPEAEKKMREELEKLKGMEITLRKARARQLIKKYHKTETAKLVQRFLRELELYDEAAAEERAKAEVRAARVREYWRKKIDDSLTGPLYRDLPVVRITNDGDQAALYQLRGYGMHWTRPRFLDPGEVDEINYPVTYRRITTEGVVVYSLETGRQYVFRQSEPGAMPQLYTVTPDDKQDSSQ